MRDVLFSNRRQQSSREIFFFRLLPMGTDDLFIHFRELTSTFVKLKSLVQRAKETLEENIIDLYKEITRLEKIENDAKILR